VNGIQSLVNVPKGTTYDKTFFSDFVVPDLLEKVRAQPKTDPEKNLRTSGKWTSSQFTETE
jgi:hypothetical protein